MRDVPIKADNIDSLSAEEYNDVQGGVENSVTTTGQTLAAGNQFQLSEAMARYSATGGVFYQDSGVADGYILSALGSFIVPAIYLDGALAVFKTANASTGPSTINIGGIGVKNLTLPNGAAISTEITANEYHSVRFNEADDRCELVAVSQSVSAASGKILQMVFVQDGEVDTGTIIVFDDDTIPQNTEGNEFMTLAITPLSATSNLVIEIVINIAGSSNSQIISSLFVDSVADALVSSTVHTESMNQPLFLNFKHVVPSLSTSVRTYKVRAGMIDVGTVTFNGESGTRRFGGVLASSIVINEVEV